MRRPGSLKPLEACCVEKDICKQTCGMSSTFCEEKYKKCSAKVCKNDQSCLMKASMAEHEHEPWKTDPTIDWSSEKGCTEGRCRGYTI